MGVWEDRLSAIAHGAPFRVPAVWDVIVRMNDLQPVLTRASTEPGLVGRAGSMAAAGLNRAAEHAGVVVDSSTDLIAKVTLANSVRDVAARDWEVLPPSALSNADVNRLQEAEPGSVVAFDGFSVRAGFGAVEIANLFLVIRREAAAQRAVEAASDRLDGIRPTSPVVEFDGRTRTEASQSSDRSSSNGYGTGGGQARSFAQYSDHDVDPMSRVAAMPGVTVEAPRDGGDDRSSSPGQPNPSPHESSSGAGGAGSRPHPGDSTGPHAGSGHSGGSAPGSHSTDPGESGPGSTHTDPPLSPNWSGAGGGSNTASLGNGGGLGSSTPGSSSPGGASSGTPSSANPVIAGAGAAGILAGGTRASHGTGLGVFGGAGASVSPGSRGITAGRAGSSGGLAGAAARAGISGAPVHPGVAGITPGASGIGVVSSAPSQASSTRPGRGGLLGGSRPTVAAPAATGAGAGGRSSGLVAAGMAGAQSAPAKDARRKGLSGHVAPKFEDENEFDARSDAANAGRRVTQKENP